MHVYDWRQSLTIMGYISYVYYQGLMSNSWYKRRSCDGLFLENGTDSEEETYDFLEQASNSDLLTC